MEPITDARISRVKVGHIISIRREWPATPKVVMGLVTAAKTLINIAGEDELLVTLMHHGDHIIHQRHRLTIHRMLDDEEIYELSSPKPPQIKYVQIDRAPKPYHPPMDAEF